MLYRVTLEDLADHEQCCEFPCSLLNRPLASTNTKHQTPNIQLNFRLDNPMTTNAMASSMIDKSRSQKLSEEAQLMLDKFTATDLRILRASLSK